MLLTDIKHTFSNVPKYIFLYKSIDRLGCGKNILPVWIWTAPGCCGPGMKPDRSCASLDKPEIWILLKKYYKTFIILNILYLFDLFITYI